MLPPIPFNKNIPETLDKLSDTLKPRGSKVLRLVNIQFIEGYELAGEVSIKIGDEPSFNLGQLIDIDDVKANKTININKPFKCGSNDIVVSAIITNSTDKFDFILSIVFSN